MTHRARKQRSMTTMPISRVDAEHYTWGTGCDGWHLVRAQGISVIEERMPPGTEEKAHWHSRARQFFYVLSGTMLMDVEGVTHELAQGTGIEIKQGLKHQVRNHAAEDLRFLVISSPPHQGDRRETGPDEE